MPFSWGRRLGHLIAALLVIGGGSVLSGCVSYVHQTRQYQTNLQRGDYRAAVQWLDGALEQRGERLLYLLERATLLRLQHEFTESTALYEDAFDLFEARYTTSVTRALSTLALNDAVQEYEGDPHERIFLHIYESLNFAQQGDFESASVPLRRMEAIQAELQQVDGKRSDQYACDAFAWLYSGLIFEANRQPDNARIALERAEACYAQSPVFRMPVPTALSLALWYNYSAARLQERMQRWRFRYGAEPESSPRPTTIVVVESGWIAVKEEQAVTMPAPYNRSGIGAVRIALPAIHDDGRLSLRSAGIRSGDDYRPLNPASDMDRVARAALDVRMPGITARTVARAVVKAQATREANDKSPLAGFGVHVMGLLSEVADTRAWRSLPSDIWIGLLALPAGGGPPILEVRLPGGTLRSFPLTGTPDSGPDQFQLLYYRIP